MSSTGIHTIKSFSPSLAWKEAIIDMLAHAPNHDNDSFIVFEYNGYYGQYSDNEPFRLFVNQVASEFVNAFDGITLYAAHDTECHILPYNSMTEEFYDMWSDNWAYLHEADTSELESAIASILEDCGYTGNYEMSEGVMCLYEWEEQELLENLTDMHNLSEDVAYAIMSELYGNTSAYSRGYAMEDEVEQALQDSNEVYFNEGSEEWEMKPYNTVYITIDLTPIQSTVQGHNYLVVSLWDNNTLIKSYETDVWNLSQILAFTRDKRAIAHNIGRNVKFVQVR